MCSVFLPRELPCKRRLTRPRMPRTPVMVPCVRSSGRGSGTASGRRAQRHRLSSKSSFKDLWVRPGIHRGTNPLTTKWGLTPPDLPQSLATPFRHDELTVATLCGSSGSRQGFEAELDERGAALPLTSRVAWERHHRPTVSWFVTVRDEAGEACGGIAIRGGWSRAIPNHLILRAVRLGDGVPLNVLRAALAGLARLAREVPRVLRAHVELFSRDTSVRGLGGRILAEEDFRPVTRPRGYTRTLAVNLDGTEEEIFRRLHATARRHIRAATKRDVRVATVSDLRYVERMRRLMAPSGFWLWTGARKSHGMSLVP